MPKTSITTEVKPEVLKWLRESSGWTFEEVSKRLSTTVENACDIEEGKRKPTLRQLKILSAVYKRPLASFFLDTPKESKPLPKDYRMLPGKSDVFDKKTVFALRRARSLQEISRELSSNIKYDVKTKLGKTKISDNPIVAAKKYRELFKLDENQKKFRNAYQLFSYLRDIMEDTNVIVFQISMPVEDARGFALTDEDPAIIVVNTKDSIEARIFSIMHEFGHVLLGETVIDMPEVSTATRNKIETWCNKFSSALLLPKETAKEIFEKERPRLIETKTLDALSRRYKVSKAMLLVKMNELGYIPKSDMKKVLARYKPKKTVKKDGAKSKGGSIPSDKKCLSEMGNKFISLVANNFDKNYITYGDALNYLSIKSKNFEKVLTKARK